MPAILLWLDRIGYCLTLDTSLQKFVIFEGRGANGKKVILETLEALIGSENCSSVALEDFVSEFHLEQTVGKAANIVSEIGDVKRLPEGKLKAFVAGDRQSFNRKHKDPIEVNPTARLVFATNRVPKFEDRSDGIWRRLVIVPCRVQIPQEKQDPDLPRKVRQELAGILNWAIAGLRRVRKQARFTQPRASMDAQRQHRDASNPENQFFDECCELDPRGSVRTELLYAHYKEWCWRRGQRGDDEATFGKRLLDHFRGAVENKRISHKGKREPHYVGVTLVQAVETTVKADMSGMAGMAGEIGELTYIPYLYH